MFALGASLVVTLCVGASSWLSPIVGPPEETHDEAVALARALLAHDEGVYSIEWSGEAWARRGAGEWETFQAADHGMDESGAWYMQARVGMREGPGREMVFSWEKRWSEDGVVQTWAQEGGDHAVRVWLDVTPLWYPNVALFLGRMCDGEGERRLGEILLAGEHLRVVTPENEAGIVRIGGVWGPDDGMRRDYLVDIDTKLGYMPVRIEVQERMRACTMEVMEVTAVEQVDGVYLPVAGDRWTYSTVEPSEAKSEELAAGLRGAGFDLTPRAVVWTPEEAERFREVVLDVFGPGGYPTEPMEGGEQRLAGVKIRSVNKGIAREKFVAELPPGMGLADGRWDEPMVIVDEGGGGLALHRAAEFEEMDFHLSPRAVRLRGVCGSPVLGELRISGIDAARVSVRSAACTTPGFVIDKLTRSGIDGSQQTLLFTGTRSEPGLWTGRLKLAMESKVQGTLEAPLTVRVLTAWRAEPAGVVLEGGAGVVGEPRTVRLVKRMEGAPAPVGVSMDAPMAGVRVELTAGGELRVVCEVGAGPAGTTSSLARVVGASGEVCAVVPIVWHAR